MDILANTTDIVPEGDQTQQARAGADQMRVGVQDFNDGFLILGEALVVQRAYLKGNQAFGEWLSANDNFGFDSSEWLRRIRNAYLEVVALGVRKSLANGKPAKIDSLAKDWKKRNHQDNLPDPDPIPAGVYQTIEADPPWHIPSGDKGPGYQYPMMDTGDIAAMVDTFQTTDNAHLYLWATNTHLDDALEVCEAWGFTYRTIITWVKPRIGLGHHFRTSTEHIIFGVKGKLDTLVNDQRTHFEAPAGRHSQKPAEAYDIIERCSPGPYLRLFARDQRDGWTSWGNEV